MTITENHDIVPGIDYPTFLDIIHTIPSCIFFKDLNLRYRFCSHKWEQIMVDDVIGKTDLEIRKDKDNAALALETDINILRTKKGCSYVIKSEIDGNTTYLELMKEPVITESGEIRGIVGLINDITEEVKLKNKVEELITKDMLTNLMNRAAGTRAIQLSLTNSVEHKAFCLIDIDKFKNINDTYGHQVGDLVLTAFGREIKNTIYHGDIAMRLGGDEFIILLKNIKNEEEVQAFLSKLCESISTIQIKELDTLPTVSIGVKLVKEGDTFDSLYAQTDKNMYKAKKDNDNYYIITE